MKGLPYILGILVLTTELLSPVTYSRTETIIAGKDVVHHSMTIDLSQPGVRLGHGLSEGLLYGFEATSGIVAREGALHGVNGLFYDDFGMPYGTLFENGKPIRLRYLDTPSLLIGENGEAALAKDKVTGYVYIGEGYTWLYGVNSGAPDGMWVLYNHHYGSNTRVWRYSTNYLISEGVVVDIIYSETPVKLSEGNQVLTYVGHDTTFEVGDSVRYDYVHSYKDFEVTTSFQTGGWLVKDGKNVAEDFDPFVGHTTAPQPRTLVGITEAGQVVFVVVDGRQPGYSVGVSGWHAAELMMAYGCVEAAYLDGGSSSTMIYDNEVISRPSKGEERKVAHAIVVYDNH